MYIMSHLDIQGRGQPLIIFSKIFIIQRNKIIPGELSPLLAGENSGTSRYLVHTGALIYN